MVGNEAMSTEMLQAKVVMIFKKGDNTKFENYRPISLLNTMYKLMAVIVQRRTAAQLDRYLQSTQCGFRKKTGERQTRCTA